MFMLKKELKTNQDAIALLLNMLTNELHKRNLFLSPKQYLPLVEGLEKIIKIESMLF
jgi:hypothetical protein